MGPTPFYGARAEKPPKKADFAMKQTNICRLSGDIITSRPNVIDSSKSELINHYACTLCDLEYLFKVIKFQISNH